MEYQEFKEAVTAAAVAAGLTDYELYYQAATEFMVEGYRQEINEYNTSTSGGACFRCIVGGKMGYAATEAFEPEQAEALVARAMENAVSIEGDDEVFLYGAGDEYEKTEGAVDEIPEAAELTEKVLACQRAAYGEDSRVIDGTQSEFAVEKGRICLVNSKGLDLAQDYSVAVAYMDAIVQEPGEEEMFDAMDIKAGRFAELTPEATAKAGVEEALASMHPQPVASGKYKVVLSGRVMATLLSTFVSVFSGEAAQQGLSLLKGKEGEAVASTVCTLVDDPFYPGSTLQMPFDAEGVATHRKEVISAGILNTLLYNLKAAKKAGREKSTGNAAKSGYASPVSIQPYHFYLKPEKAGADLFGQAGSGLYITDINGTHAGANAATGDFSLSSSGFLIKDGEKGGPVKGFTIAGNFFQMLKNIEAVGSEVKFGMPHGFSIYGAPDTLIAELSVAGK